MQRRQLLSQTIAIAALAGCGFHLRHPPQMGFRSIALTGFAPRSPMANELRAALKLVHVEVTDAPAQAQLVLQAVADSDTKTVAAVTAAGQVREFQLWQRLTFQVRTPSGRELIPATEISLSRELSHNETMTLAKEQEEALLYQAMRSDIIAQLLRRLAALPPLEEGQR